MLPELLDDYQILPETQQYAGMYMYFRCLVWPNPFTFKGDQQLISPYCCIMIIKEMFTN